MNTVNNFGSKHAILSVAAGLALSLCTGAAWAGGTTTDSLPSVTVKYDAVQAATPVGAEKLYKQIKVAAATVCERYASQELVRRLPWQKCYSQVVSNAVSAVHQPELTALHSRTTSEPRG
jgi:UrcA family protein